jgi:hypothetical protein
MCLHRVYVCFYNARINELGELCFCVLKQVGFRNFFAIYYRSNYGMHYGKVVDTVITAL